MIVPDADERPARAGILEVGISEIALVHGAIAVDGQRVVEIAGLSPIGNARDLIDRPVEAGVSLFGILNDLVDEVAKVQHEAKLILRPRAFVFEDHPAISVELSFVDALAADEGEVHRPRVVRPRRGDGAADAAAVAVRVGESIPIDPRRLEPADEHPGGPVRRLRNRGARLRDDPAEPLVFGDFDRQYLALAFTEGPAGPQENAVGLGIARCDAFREQVASLPPVYLGTRARRSAQRQSRAAGRGLFDEFSSVDSAHIILLASTRSPRCRDAPKRTRGLFLNTRSSNYESGSMRCEIALSRACTCPRTGPPRRRVRRPRRAGERQCRRRFRP